MQLIMKELMMSINSVLFLASCFAMYKLGTYNAKYPGEVWRRLCEGARWTWKFLHQ
jgi:hypothetical protein